MNSKIIEITDPGALTRNWGPVLFRGIAAVIFGVLTLFAPGISLVTLVLLFGSYALVDGLLTLVSAIRHRGTSAPWSALLLHGLAGIGAGVLTFLWPGVTALALLYLVAGWALVTGVLEIATAIRLRKVIEGEWLLMLSGVASIALSVLLVIFPVPGILTLIIWVGAYAIAFGAFTIALAFRLRSRGRSQPPTQRIGAGEERLFAGTRRWSHSR